jgi:phosphoribosylformylglycinamidine (FGAM) synthase PurS component
MAYGEVSVEFTDNADLQEKLDKIDFDALANTVAGKVPSIVVEQRKVREDIKDFVDTDGKFMILKNIPKTKIDIVMLAIYAYGTSATIEEIRRTPGILDPSGDAINSGSSKKYFIPIDKQTYGLSTEGIRTATTEIISSLRQKKEMTRAKVRVNRKLDGNLVR